MWEPMHEANADELKQHGTFDVSNLRSVRGELNKHWPSCHPKHDSEKFWEHEWSGYGTYTGMTQLQYFKKALSLLDLHSADCPAPSPTGSSDECHLCFSKDLSRVVKCSKMNKQSHETNSYFQEHKNGRMEL